MTILICTVGLMACNNSRNNDTDRDTDNRYDRYTDNRDTDNRHTDRYTDNRDTDNRHTDRYTDGESARPDNPTISLERAIELAYEDLDARGISATFRSDSGMEWERGQWVWELLFTTEGESMPFVEYYISVEDGSIVKFEWDD